MTNKRKLQVNSKVKNKFSVSQDNMAVFSKTDG